MIFEENASYDRVIGSPDAPFFNQLARQCALATDFHESAGVSQPNSMAAIGGEASRVGVVVDAPSIFDQAASWAELRCHNHHWGPRLLAGRHRGGEPPGDGYLASGDGRTLILIAFDEAGDPGVTTVPMVALAAGVQPVADDTPYDQYALLRASETALGITTFLGRAAAANDMRSGMHFWFEPGIH